MESITVPQSVFVDGQWATAHWMVECVDGESGELVITATVTGPGAPRVTALRMDMGLASELRRMAGFVEQPAPEGSRVLCYDCRTTEQRLALLEQRLDNLAIPGLRAQVNAISDRVTRLEALDVQQWEQITKMNIARNEHLRDIDRRLNALEAAAAPAIANRAWMDEVERQLAAHGEQLTALEDKINHLAGAVVMEAVVKAMREQDGV